MKNRFSFPARFEPDAHDGGYVVTFRDVPEAITQGEDLSEARVMALDALATSMEFYLEDHRTVPEPSALQGGEELVTLPVSTQAKLLLLNEMVGQRLRPVDLAKAMGVKPQEVTRILDLKHTTKIDTLAEAFEAVGRRLLVDVSAKQ